MNMNHTTRRYVLSIFAFAAALSAACGGTQSTGLAADGGPLADGGTEGGTPADASTGDGGNNPAPKTRAIVRMNGGAAAGCITVPMFTVGDFGDSTMGVAPKPVENGDVVSGRVVTITCRVAAAAAGGFELEANVTTAGDTTLTIRGTLDAQGKTKAGIMTLKKTSTWSSSSCVLDPTALPQGAVAPGRYWTSLACGGSTSDTAAMCDIFGELRVENCAQQ